MIPAKYSDKERVVSILARSFADNPSINYAVRQDAKRQLRTNRLMEYCFENCFYTGAVYLSEDQHGCALILYPDKKKFTLRSLWLDIKLIAGVMPLSNIKNILNKEAQVKQNHPVKPFTHLWYIGVDPGHQHKGIGKALLLNILEESKKTGRDIYLETSVPGNITWYKKYGFEVYKELQFSTTLYLLKYAQ